MNVASFDDGVASQDEPEPQAPPTAAGRARGPITFRLGPVVVTIPFGLIPAPLLGLFLFAGASGYTALSVSDSQIGRALAQTLQSPRASLYVTDAMSGDEILPAKKTYVVKPGQVLIFEHQPGAPPIWVSLGSDGYGTLDPPSGRANKVRFIAPPLPEGVTSQAGSITVCSGDVADTDKANCSMPIVITTQANVR